MSDSSGTHPQRSGETVTYKTTIQANEGTTGAIVRLLERIPTSSYEEVSPLYEHVDPEALDQLFANTNSVPREGTATVTVGNLQIVVRDSKRVEIRVPVETVTSSAEGGSTER
ncbi:HalOD1 output domain-containing protein [Halostagnicola bangensis]